MVGLSGAFFSPAFSLEVARRFSRSAGRYPVMLRKSCSALVGTGFRVERRSTYSQQSTTSRTTFYSLKQGSCTFPWNLSAFGIEPLSLSICNPSRESETPIPHEPCFYSLVKKGMGGSWTRLFQPSNLLRVKRSLFSYPGLLSSLDVGLLSLF